MAFRCGKRMARRIRSGDALASKFFFRIERKDYWRERLADWSWGLSSWVDRLR